MRLRVLAAALVVASLGLAAVAFAGGSQANRPRLTVFAAASLTDVFPQIDARARYSFGGSNMLAAQIQQGLPADVFVSANRGLPWQLHRKGLVTRPVVFTANKLVIVIARGWRPPGCPLATTHERCSSGWGSRTSSTRR
jgi:molybdate transport system substrate-binding protein